MGSLLYEQQRAKPDAVAVWTVHLHFDEFFDVPAKDFYWSTAEGGVELADGNFYIHALSDVPRGRNQSDRGNDYAECVVANPDASVLIDFEPYQDFCEKGQVTICECYEIIEGQDVFEEEIKFFGYIKDFNVDDTDHTIKFTFHSDMSRSGFLVGNRILTRERCGTEFNFNGTIPATYHPCGWQTVQGGNPLFCSKLLEGVDGCKAHNNAHRFFAVPALSTADVEILPSTGTDDTGFDYSSGPCFTNRMFMLMDMNLNVLPLDEVRTGMGHVGVDIFNGDALVEAEILWNKANPTDHYWTAEFLLANIEGSDRHPFYIGRRAFSPMAQIGTRRVLGLSADGKPATDALLSLERHLADDFFYEFRSTSGNYIICDEGQNFFYIVHNLKPFAYDDY